MVRYSLQYFSSEYVVSQIKQNKVALCLKQTQSGPKEHRARSTVAGPAWVLQRKNSICPFAGLGTPWCPKELEETAVETRLGLPGQAEDSKCMNEWRKIPT